MVDKLEFFLHGVSGQVYSAVRYNDRWYGWECPVVDRETAENILEYALDGRIAGDGTLVLEWGDLSFTVEPDSDGLYALPGQFLWLKDTDELDYAHREGYWSGERFTIQDVALDFETPPDSDLRELLYSHGWLLCAADGLPRETKVLLLRVR